MNAEPERDPPKAFQRPSPGELPNAFKPKAPPDSPRVPTAAASPFAFAPPPTFDEPLGLPPLGSESGEEVVVERRRPQFNRVFALLLLAAVGSPLYGCCLCCGLAPFSSSPLFVTGTPNLYNPVLMIAWFGMTGVLAVVPGWAAIWLGLSQLLPRTQSSEWTRPVTTFFEPQSVPALLAFVLVVLFVGWTALGWIIIGGMGVVVLLLTMQRARWRLADGEPGEPAPIRFSIKQIVLLTVASAVVFSLARGLAVERGEWRTAAALLLVVSSFVVADVVGTALFLAVDRPALGWLVVLAISLVPGGLVMAIAAQSHPLKDFDVILGLPHGLVLCGFLQFVRQAGVRIVRAAEDESPATA